jgi:hypothetical protein
MRRRAKTERQTVSAGLMRLAFLFTNARHHWPANASIAISPIAASAHAALLTAACTVSIAGQIIDNLPEDAERKINSLKGDLPLRGQLFVHEMGVHQVELAFERGEQIDRCWWGIH